MRGTHGPFKNKTQAFNQFQRSEPQTQKSQPTNLKFCSGENQTFIALAPATSMPIVVRRARHTKDQCLPCLFFLVSTKKFNLSFLFLLFLGLSSLYLVNGVVNVVNVGRQRMLERGEGNVGVGEVDGGGDVASDAARWWIWEKKELQGFFFVESCRGCNYIFTLLASNQSYPSN